MRGGQAYKMFYPHYSDFSNTVIDGTQFMPESGNNMIDFQNFKEEDFQFKDWITNSGYKHYENTDDKAYGLLIETRLTDGMRQKENQLSVYEKNHIFDNQIRVLLNLIPQNFLEDVIELHFDFLAPNEYFEGRSEALYILSDPSIIFNKIKYEDEYTQLSLV